MLKKIQPICISKKLKLYLANLPKDDDNDWNGELVKEMMDSVAHSAIKSNRYRDDFENVNSLNIKSIFDKKYPNISSKNMTEVECVQYIADEMIYLYFDYKIALFEKRYSVYIQLQKCVMYGEILNFNIGNIGPGTINFLFLKTFLDDTIGLKDITQDGIDRLFNDVWNKIKQSEFLFDRKSSGEIVLLSKALFELIASIDRENDVESKIKCYSNQAAVIKEQIMPKIQEQLKLD